MLEFLRNMVTMRRDRNERGASAVEYGLLVGGIAALIVVLVFALGDNVTKMFDNTCKAVQAEAKSTTC